MRIAELLAAIEATPYCEIYEPVGLPQLREGHVLPDDVREFYTLCGGLVLFDPDLVEDITLIKIKPLQLIILSPDQVQVANPFLLGDLGLTDEQLPSTDDISFSWYTIARGRGNAQYVTIKGYSDLWYTAASHEGGAGCHD